jgi:hypothetical protein
MANFCRTTVVKPIQSIKNKKNFFFFNFRTDGTESPILPESETDTMSDKPKIKYGELVILG